MIQIDRRHFIAGLGGTAAVAKMSHEARAEALEEYMIERLNPPQSGQFPTSAEVEAQITTRHYRRGAGNLFLMTAEGSNVAMLDPMPERPTIQDFFEHRFGRTRNHCFQSANRAMETGQSEEVILACLLHDTVQELIKVDHGYWGAQMYGPYVPERTSMAIRYHQALRFYADEEHGYAYPDLYHRMFGEDYVPAPYIQDAKAYIESHDWYMDARMVTVSDLYAFQEGVVMSIEPYLDLLGRHFKQPAEGLGYDNSTVAHMWRSIAMPDNPL
jgi:hypothetical protein